MTIKKTLNGRELTIAIDDQLNTATAPQLEKELEGLDGIDKLIFDFAELEYISSAGLRVLLMAQKIMNKHGKEMVIRNANADLKDIFEITGFIDLMNVE